MDLNLIVVIVLAACVALYYLRSKGAGSMGRGKSRSLRQQARRQLKLPPEQADQAIDRQIMRLKERYPGRTEEWYLEKIIYDFERDH